MDGLELRERVDQIIKKTERDFVHRERELRKLLKEAEKAEDVYAVGVINLNLCICLFELGKRGNILPYACKAVGIFENSDERELLARSYNLLGIAYDTQENYESALDSFNKALEAIRGQRKPVLRKEMILNNIAESYHQMGEFQKSVRIMSNCLAICRKKTPGNHTAITVHGLNLSELYESMEEHEKAKEILADIEPDVAQLGDSVFVYGFYARRSCVLYRLGDMEGGARNADLALQGIRADHGSHEFHKDFEKIASIEVKNGDYKRAQRFADILTEYADKYGNTLDQIISKRVQGSICYSRGEMDRALTLYKELNDLYERRMREQNELQYESQKNSDAAAKEIGKLMHKIRLSEEKAERDALTGLMNRSALVSVTNGFIQTAKEKAKKLGGIFLDIDYFKEYNDTYGHAAGDEAIKFIARVCMDEETGSIKFFRYGGDEYFGVILGHKDADLDRLALRISEKVRHSGFEHVKNPNGQRLTVSIGIVNVDMKDSEDTILDIIKYADKALYHSKDVGKNVAFAIHVMPNDEHEYRRIEQN